MTIERTKTHRRQRNLLWVKRIVMTADGTPVGRGKPQKSERLTRFVKFIPANQTYGSHKLESAMIPFDPKADSMKTQFKRTYRNIMKPVAVAVPAEPVQTVEVVAETPAPPVEIPIVNVSAQ